MTKSNILKEAMLDAKQIKEAAIENAQSVLMEHMKDKIENFVDAKLNEEEEPKMELNEELDTLPEEGEEMGDDGLDLGDDEEEMGDDDLDLGLTEEDLEEALENAAAALTEVEHAQLGEMDFVDPDSHPTGLMDDDQKEDGWQNKKVPAAKDWTVKESAYKKAIAKLVKENTLYKKANGELKGALDEVKLFNAKLYYATKILQTEGLNKTARVKVIKSIDQVSSLSEAKRVFETWQAAIGLMGEGAEKPTKGKKAPKLTEAYGLDAKTDGKGISEVAEGGPKNLNEARYGSEAARWVQIAGISKKK